VLALRRVWLLTVFLGVSLGAMSQSRVQGAEKDQVVHVFFLGGQSNAVGSDAVPGRINEFPPYVGVGNPQQDVLYSYDIQGNLSNGWVDLRPAANVFGAELTFARELKKYVKYAKDKIAIIKCAVGGTTIAVNWNPDSGPLYRTAMDLIKVDLADLQDQGYKVQLEAVLWHQGENDMLNGSYRPQYEQNLTDFIARVREELSAPDLPFYIGEISDKGIWGMDNRSNMIATREQQLRVVEADPLVWWVPSRHLGFEVMGSGQPHYHFGTLGQLQLGESFAKVFLQSTHQLIEPKQPGFEGDLPFAKTKPIKVFILAGTRNMEGEESFISELAELGDAAQLVHPQEDVLYRCLLGGGEYQSQQWQALGPIDNYLGYFGPELSFGQALRKTSSDPIAIIKVADGCGVMLDWDHTLSGYRGMYKKSLAFIQASLDQLEQRGYSYTLEAVVWHQGEHDTYFSSYRNNYGGRLKTLIAGLRQDLQQANLRWFVCEQSTKSPWGASNITAMNDQIKSVTRDDPNTFFVMTSDLPHTRRIHFGAEGSVRLGARMAEAYLTGGNIGDDGAGQTGTDPDTPTR
jgi:hypothetical protein